MGIKYTGMVQSEWAYKVLECFTANGHKRYWNGSQRMGIKATGMGQSEWA